ncbi:hypothetical protein [Gordoniibacillus kamchatkensis]|nr:hypothetical protein [Paenibacillus sp. VKM B-2647]
MKDLRDIDALGTITVELRPGDRIVRREQVEALREKEKRDRRREVHPLE